MNRVVITGMGVVSPIGNTLEEFKKNLLNGVSGVRLISHFDPAQLPTRIAAESHLPHYAYKDHKIDFALAAIQSALTDADVHCRISCLNHYPRNDRGLDIGMGLELFDMKDLIRFINSSSPVSSDPRPEKDFLQTPADWCSSLIEKQWVLGLPSIIHISACAAATDALGHGFLRIRCGQARMIIAGGTDSMINPLGLGGFCKLQALSSRNETPQSASRPFDLHRDGFVLGEGAGFLILENLDDARSRNSRIYGEIVGYGNSFDAHAITEPHPQGYGAFLAMKRALQMAAIDPEQISYINAHGTSTPKNDRAETLAIKTLFAKHAYHIPVSSSKSMIGHLISAAGAVEVIASLICAQLNMIHPTINLDSPDPELDLDYVPQKARAHKISYFLSNSFAFGGMNATVVIKNGGLDA